MLHVEEPAAVPCGGTRSRTTLSCSFGSVQAMSARVGRSVGLNGWCGIPAGMSRHPRPARCPRAPGRGRAGRSWTPPARGSPTPGPRAVRPRRPAAGRGGAGTAPPPHCSPPRCRRSGRAPLSAVSRTGIPADDPALLHPGQRVGGALMPSRTQAALDDRHPARVQRPAPVPKCSLTVLATQRGPERPPLRASPIGC